MDWTFLLILLLVGTLGIVLRTHSACAGMQGMGHDERLYAGYIATIVNRGPTAFPEVVASFIRMEEHVSEKLVPPTRCLYLLAAGMVCRTFGCDLFTGMKAVSCLFSLLAMVVSAAFAWRLGGKWWGLGVLALMSVAPLQVFNAHRALVDGVLSFWSILALWMFWENLQRPRARGWLLAYGVTLTMMTLTKETSVFVVAALAALLATTRWTRLGTPTAWLWATTFLGPAAAGGLLALMCGGLEPLVQVVRIDLFKPLAPFTIAHADGPWYGYILGLLVLSPTITMLSLAAMFNPRLDNKGNLLMLLFVLLTYAPMACVPYQVVVRLATLWDMPLRWLVLAQVVQLAGLVPSRYPVPIRQAVLVGMVAIVCLLDLRQFYFFFQVNGVYEPVTDVLLRCINVVK